MTACQCHFVVLGLAGVVLVVGLLVGRKGRGGLHALPSQRPYMDVVADLMDEGARHDRILIAAMEGRSARIGLLERKLGL